MRKLELGLTISGAIHVAAIAWLGVADLGRDDRDAPQVTTTTIEVVPAQPEPENIVEVRVLDEAATKKLEEIAIAPAATQPTRKRTPRAAGTAAITTNTGPASIGPGTSEPIGPGTEGPRTKYFDMRRGDRADLTLPTARFDALDNAPAGTAPQPGVPASGQLESAAGGRKKSHQDVFVAKVERDGKVKLTDTRNLQAELSLNPAKLLSGRFDINDYLMRRSKNDPYASRKLKFLDETRDERAAMGLEWKRQQLQQTAMLMRKNLERAWASSTDVATRKRALFALWDEIVETDGSDEMLAEASRTARKAVIGFIRARLPQDSEHAFTQGELLALNSTKQSSATFAPYE